MIDWKLTAASVILTVVTATSAAADTFLKYGEVDGWNVYIDSEKKSCLIESIDEAENVVQMGLTKDRGVAYLGVFIKGETGIKQGDKEAVAINIGDNLYIGEATGMRGNITKGYSGGYVLSDDPQFVDDIARQSFMTVFPQKEFAFVVSLDGTLNALKMARKCSNEQLE